VIGGMLGYDATDQSSPFVSKSVNFIFGNSELGGYQIAATFTTNSTFKEPQIVRVIFDNVKDPGTCKLSQTNSTAGSLTAYTNPWGTATLDEKVLQDYWHSRAYDRHLYQTKISAFPNKTYELDCRLQTIPLADGAHRTVVFIPPNLFEQGLDSPSGFDYVHDVSIRYDLSNALNVSTSNSVRSVEKGARIDPTPDAGAVIEADWTDSQAESAANTRDFIAGIFLGVFGTALYDILERSLDTKHAKANEAAPAGHPGRKPQGETKAAPRQGGRRGRKR
jgi:hypothetical protein